MLLDFLLELVLGQQNVENIRNFDLNTLDFNFDNLVTVDIRSQGYIAEMKLNTPAFRTRMPVYLIFRYQEDDYIITYGEEYLERMYHLIMIYNSKLKIDQGEGLNRNLPFLDKSLKYVLRRMKVSKDPKYFRYIESANALKNPFFDAVDYNENKRNDAATVDYLMKKLRNENNDNGDFTLEEYNRSVANLDQFIHEANELNKNHMSEINDNPKNTVKPTDEPFDF